MIASAGSNQWAWSLWVCLAFCCCHGRCLSSWVDSLCTVLVCQLQACYEATVPVYPVHLVYQVHFVHLASSTLLLCFTGTIGIAQSKPSSLGFKSYFMSLSKTNSRTCAAGAANENEKQHQQQRSNWWRHSLLKSKNDDVNTWTVVTRIRTAGSWNRTSVVEYTGWVKKVSCCTVIDISKARQ